MASLSDTVEIKGLQALGERLTQLPLEIKEKIAAKAMLKAANITLAAVQVEVPIRTGNLYRHLRISRRKRGVPGTVVQYVIFVKTGGGGKAKAKNFGEDLPYYWYMIEFGWNDKSGKHHPGKPFLLLGFERSVENAAAQARDEASYLLSKVAKT